MEGFQVPARMSSTPPTCSSPPPATRMWITLASMQREGQGDCREYRPLRQRDRHGGLYAVVKSGSKPSQHPGQYDEFVFPKTGWPILVLAEGRLMNPTRWATSFVMSSSFTNQTIAQLDLWLSACGKPTLSGLRYETGRVYTLPKKLDEEVARLHLEKLGVRLTSLTKDQADYLGIPVEGPYKAEHYRY